MTSISCFSINIPRVSKIDLSCFFFYYPSLSFPFSCSCSSAFILPYLVKYILIYSLQLVDAALPSKSNIKDQKTHLKRKANGDSIHRMSWNSLFCASEPACFQFFFLPQRCIVCSMEFCTDFFSEDLFQRISRLFFSFSFLDHLNCTRIANRIEYEQLLAMRVCFAFNQMWFRARFFFWSPARDRWNVCHVLS